MQFQLHIYKLPMLEMLCIQLYRWKQELDDRKYYRT